jgi:hypothetical protein
MWFVQHAERRSMYDQNVCVVGNHFPISSDRRAVRDIECPIIEFGLNWRSPDFQSRQLDARVFEIYRVRRE